MIVWLREPDVLAMHLELIREHGGSPGLRDEGLFQSALARPLNLANYGDPDLFELAAAYAFGLVRNHAFIDGNKRIGFAAMAVFLELNGYELTAPQTAAVEMVLSVATGEAAEADIAAWLRAHVRPR